jgi:hypothetical protein
METWLDVNDDGTLTYHRKNNGWRMARRGLEPSDEVMSAEKAKARWPGHAANIDAALAKIAKKSD